MAGEVTRRQQRLQVAAEDPPSFLGAGIYGIGGEKAKAEADISKFGTTNLPDKASAVASKKASLRMKARLKAKMTRNSDK